MPDILILQHLVACLFVHGNESLIPFRIRRSRVVSLWLNLRDFFEVLDLLVGIADLESIRAICRPVKNRFSFFSAISPFVNTLLLTAL